MILNSAIVGDSDNIPVVILHGLYGSGESWIRVAGILEAKYKVYLPDLRNHGKSFHHPSHTYNELAEDVKIWADNLGLKRFYLVGHSMGGKTAMFFANKYPEMIEKMIIADISPRSYSALMDHVESIQFHLNLINMMKTLPIETFSSYKIAAAHISNYDENIRNIVLKNLRKENGRMFWKMNVDAIFNNLPEIMDGLNPDDFIDRKIGTPTLFLKAELSNYMTDQDKKLIDFIFTKANVEIVPAASHWLHYEQPEEVAGRIGRFFE
jgi:esterase